MVVYGRYNASQIKFVSYDIQTKKSLSAEIKIVLISDLHLGAVNSEKNLSKIVQGINSLEPDIVCIAGDIFNNNIDALQNPSEAIALLKSVTAKYGVYACLGNHDGGKTFKEMTRFLEQSNIKLLNDDHVAIDGRLVLTGRVDSRPIGGFDGLKRKNFADINVPANTDLPVVVMEHNPSNLGQYGNEIDLILSGHTHRGQIFPANLVTKVMYVTHYGRYQKDDNSPHVIVTSGAGIWGMPMRIGSNNEIVMITLH
jgi:predicted MPP superfamily phosphohydrolase